MSQVPMVIDGVTARWGASLGSGITAITDRMTVLNEIIKGMKAEDLLWAGLTDSYAKLPMGLTGNLYKELTE